MTQASTCPKCGAWLPSDAPAGLCPKCLVAAGLHDVDQSEASLGATAPSPAHPAFEPPPVEQLAKRFPQLEILELLGKGGMGAVYKARQRGLDRLVAVKILPPEVGRDAAFAERFTREARAMGRLSHPNIVGVYDFGQADGLFYLVMEYVDGANLRQTMQAGRIKPEQALAIVPQICDALQYAHDEGIVHRDIKPENVLIDTKGRVKIADFGLAKLLDRETADPALTQTRQIMGTPRYMAPEQMAATHNVDHRADIYSLGVVFYELLTGDVPAGRFDPPSKRVQVDVRLDEVVLRALSQEPAQRYQRASELKSDVETVASSPHVMPEAAVGAAGGAVASDEPTDEAAAEVDLESSRREVRIPAIGLMVVGVLSALGGLLLLLLPVVFLALKGSAEAAARQEMAAQMETELQEAEGDSNVQVRTNVGSPTWLMVIAVPLLLLGSLASIAPGAVIVLGGWRMMSLQGYGLAVTASILALVPCQPVSLLGLVFGIWSLVVLNRPGIRAAFKKASRLAGETKDNECSAAEISLNRAGAGMMVVGMLNCASPFVFLGGRILLGFAGIPGPWELLALLATIGTGVAMILGGWKMRIEPRGLSPRRRRLVHATRIREPGRLSSNAAILALVPCSLLWPLNVFAGICSLIVLARPDVQDLLAEYDGGPRDEKQPGPASP